MQKKNNIEVALLRPKAAYNLVYLKQKLDDFVRNLINFHTIIHITTEEYPELSESVQTIRFDENLQEKPNENETTNYYFYHPYPRSYENEMIENSEGEDETCASSHWILPNKEFEGLYESLIYDNEIKEQILKFSESAIIFGNYNVDKNIITCNRIILLHGPPGTGKTSLCKAIAQKISIRLNSIYKYTHFIEINSHSLFSKWFSESGKLVAKLFAKIREMILQPNCLVCVLIDEVESIAYDRSNLSGEPKDALRVVNAVLTQLDQLKHYSNVMIFATSNLMNTIDIAFVDRVDLKKFIGFPTSKAIYSIYLSAINDLIRVGLITLKENTKLRPYETEIITETKQLKNSCILKDVVEASHGLSGRILRKIPFLAHTFGEHSADQINKMSLENFLNSMLKAICDRNSMV